MCHMTCVTCHVSHVTCHLSGVTCQVSCFRCHLSHVRCHMSCVTCHVSPVTCNLSHVTCHIFLLLFSLQSGEASQGRVCYQRGLPRLVFHFLAIIISLKILQMRNLHDITASRTFGYII